MTNPLVSLCVPTRNRARDLVESLKTIVGQQYDPLEILISDNCSDDDTERVCRELAASDPRVRYVRHDTNIGLHRNHNFCFDESRGEFMCFFHDHDSRDLDLVATYVRFMQEHPNVGIVCSDWTLMNEVGDVVGVRDYHVQPVTSGLDYIDQTLRSGRSSIGLPGMLLRKEALGATRFIEDAPVGLGDFPIWFQIAEKFDIGHISQRLWRWRVQRASQSARTIVSLTDDYYRNLMHYCDAHLGRWPAHTVQVERWRGYIRKYLFWALVYEVGLHFSRRRKPTPSVSVSQFEILDYHLSPEEFALTLARLEQYKTGPLQHAASLLLRLMVALRLTWPLTMGARHYEFLRGILGLKER